jgi:RNA polymerase sporulation-specific sigma factor
MVIDNLGLVRYVAKKYRKMYYYEDLLQEGTIGLIQAAQKFDPSRKVAFSSMAVPYIRGYISHYFRDKLEIVRSPCSSPSLPVASLDFSSNGIDKDLLDFLVDPACLKDEQLDNLKEYSETLPEKKRQCLEGLMRGDRAKDQAKEIGVSNITITRWKKEIVQLAKKELGQT